MTIKIKIGGDYAILLEHMEVYLFCRVAVDFTLHSYGVYYYIIKLIFLKDIIHFTQ